MSALAEAAAAYARRGWPILPAGRNKRPLTPNGLLDATTDLARIEPYWTAHPDANVAVRTGEPSGLVVLDIDGQAGADNLAELERRHGELPMTTSVKTPRGGSHYWFIWPGAPVKTTAGAIAPGIDIRGDGGYVLAPPSSTAAGRYEWDETTPPARMPGWLVELTRADAATAAATSPEVWTTMVRDGIHDGQRNASLTRLTGHLLRHWVDGDLAAELVHLVNAARCRPPLPRADVDRIIDSISAREAQRLAHR